MPRPKIGLFAKNVVDPPRDLTHVRARKRKNGKMPILPRYGEEL